MIGIILLWPYAMSCIVAYMLDWHKTVPRHNSFIVRVRPCTLTFPRIHIDGGLMHRTTSFFNHKFTTMFPWFVFLLLVSPKISNQILYYTCSFILGWSCLIDHHIIEVHDYLVDFSYYKAILYHFRKVQ